MEMNIAVGKKRYAVNTAQPLDISIPVRFDGGGLSAFSAPPPRKAAHAAEGFIGDVTQGGSCNCDVLTFAPHLSGTHTECVGHIISEPMAAYTVVRESLIPATLITVKPDTRGSDTYIPKRRRDDPLITREAVFRALLGCDADFLTALVVRTLPNGPEKLTQNYGASCPPFFSLEAMDYLVSCGVRHLLVDVPSIDRLDDEGKLSNHHIFWNVQPGSRQADIKSFADRTVTELVYVPDTIGSGIYMLDLQVAPLMSDAAPSRPLLYGVTLL